MRNYFVIVLSKPIVLHGDIVEVIGPFESSEKALDWGLLNLPKETHAEIKCVWYQGEE